MKLISIGLPASVRGLSIAAVSLAVAGPAIAQGQITSDPIFEEIVVTSQKREQNIMDVPIAVSAVTGAQIEEAGIKDVFDLQQNVPGLIVGRSQTSTSSNFSIRGIGSTSNNFGVESSVGLYVDGVYRSRQSSLINELIDVEAVEVLRGPQGTLFGKNTPAGAIQIRTVRPGQTNDAFIDIGAGDYDLMRISGAANIVLSDNLAFRGTVFSSRRDGYVSDDFLGEDLYNDRDRFGVRAQLMWEPSDDLNIRVIADHSEVDEVCCVAVSRVDGLYSQASLGGVPVPGSDAAFVQFGGRVFTSFPYPQPFIDAFAPFPGSVVTGVDFEDYRVAYNDAPVSQNEDRGISLEINKTLGGGSTLTSISAYRAFDTYDLIDGDFSNVDIFTRINEAEQQSFTQELRLAGEFGEGSNYVVGAYYFTQEIKSITDTNTEPLFAPYVIAVNPSLQQIVDGVNAVSAFLNGNGIPFPPAASPFPLGTLAHDEVLQDHSAFAVFAQIDWSLSDNFTLTLGGRYTDEDKDIVADYTQTAQGPAPDLAAIEAALTAAALGQPFDPAVLLPVAAPNDGWGSYLFAPLAPRPDLRAGLTDSQFTGTAKLSWFPSDASMFYASFSTGFKSGGTNTDRINPAFNPIFGAETSESVEVGFKGDIGPFRVAASIFDTTYDDFQANSFTGTGFNLQNAGKVDTNGFEIEALWRPFDTVEVQAFYARNEGDYASFVGGTCWDTAVFHTGQPDPGGSTPGAEVCDKTGNPIAYNPEDRGFLALTKDFMFDRNSLYVRAEWSYYSEQFTDGDLDPFTVQDAFSLLNLRAGLAIDSWNSELTVWGRNVTDERIYYGSFDAPIQLGRMNSYPSEPATWGVSFRKNFE